MVNLRGKKDGKIPEGYIRLASLKRKAMEEKDEFLFQRYKEENQKLTESHAQKHGMCIVFALLLSMLLTNFMVSAKFPGGDGAMRALAALVPAFNPDWTDIVFWNALVLFVSTGLAWDLFEPKKNALIDFPWSKKE